MPACAEYKWYPSKVPIEPDDRNYSGGAGNREVIFAVDAHNSMPRSRFLIKRDAVSTTALSQNAKTSQ